MNAAVTSILSCRRWLNGMKRAEGGPVLIEIARGGEGVKQLRTEPRMKVLLTAEMSSRRGAFGCRVVDISRGGACLDADRAHDVGEDVSFHRGSLRAKGRVVWSRGRRFGVQFDEPIRATELLVQMSHSRTAAVAAQRPRELSLSVPPSPST
jgi:hypothetical protein